MAPLGVPGKLQWVTEVSHFTWWNSDHPWYEKHCYNVTVLDLKNNPMQNAYVTGVGVSYVGISWPKITGMDGLVCVEVQKNSTARIYLGYTGDPNTPPAGSYLSVTVPDVVSDCTGQGAACEAITLNTNLVCSPGSWQKCTYNGPQGTEGVGICHAGMQYCKPDGSGWNLCYGEATPKMADDCSTAQDENCNNIINDGCPIICANGTPQSCYTGPAGTQGVGICKSGTSTCMSNGTMWGPCIGQVTPFPWEICYPFYPDDDDCDGTQSECKCTVFTSKTCYQGPGGTQGLGACKSGTSYCYQNWSTGGGSDYGTCLGQVLPAPEDCTNGKDDDCDGLGDADEFSFATGDCCNSISDCYLTGTGDCKSPDCNASKKSCIYTPKPKDELATQVAGNCRIERCDGVGDFYLANIDQNDVFVDFNPCTTDKCNNNGISSNDPIAPGQTCEGNAAWVCDPQGQCVQCYQGSNNCGPMAQCYNGECVACNDSTKNGKETDVDCGGDCAACADGKECLSGADCQSNVCSAGCAGCSPTCQAPTCSDQARNCSESDVDCGGGLCNASMSQCPKCGNGRHCSVASDCISDVCQMNVCVPASCNDGKMNNTETDVDCGGAGCSPCPAGKMCTVGGDCTSGKCIGGICQ